MLDLALLALLVAWLYHLAKSQAQQVKAQQSATAAVPAPSVLRINLDGVKRLPGVPGFVSRFGVKAKWVSDMGYFVGPAKLADLPVQTQECLRMVYDQGGTRGPEVPGLLYRDEAVPAGKALYLAACSGQGPECLLAFVHDAPARTGG